MNGNAISEENMSLPLAGGTDPWTENALDAEIGGANRKLQLCGEHTRKLNRCEIFIIINISLPSMENGRLLR